MNHLKDEQVIWELFRKLANYHKPAADIIYVFHDSPRAFEIGMWLLKRGLVGKKLVEFFHNEYAYDTFSMLTPLQRMLSDIDKDKNRKVTVKDLYGRTRQSQN